MILTGGEGNPAYSSYTPDPNGHFSIPSHLRGPSPSWFSSISKYPFVQVIHPDYGRFYFQYSIDYMDGYPKLDFPGYRNLKLEIEPSELYLQVIKDPSLYSRMCPSGNRDTCIRACEVAYGSVEVCYEAGLPRD